MSGNAKEIDMTMNMRVAEGDLCTNCGTCVALCPNEALRLAVNRKKGIYILELDEDRCSDCGICLQVCPGYEVDFEKLNSEAFGKEPTNIMIGNYVNCYTGHSTNHHLRYGSASGGVVTQLLIFALESGRVDGALVTRMKRDSPLEPEAFIARTKSEIIEASKSKYCPVPANTALREILESEEGERFATVGLPCHIHGLRKAEMINKNLGKKIVLHVGLFCGHTPSFAATRFLIRTLGVQEEELKGIAYRGEGWPGGVSFTLRSGNRLFVPHAHPYAWGAILSSVFFVPYRCLLCPDGTSELADISFGDAWLPELVRNSNAGESIVVSRTQRGEEILRRMANEKVIVLNQIPAEKVILSQQDMLNHKKKSIQARIRVFRSLGKTTPSFNCRKISDANSTSLLRVLPLCLSNLLFGKRGVNWLINHMPANFLIKHGSLVIGVGQKWGIPRLGRKKS